MSLTMTNGAGAHTAGHGSGQERAALVPSRLFAGKSFVVVGGTGFLGKVWLSLFLHRFPEVAHLYLMVRPK